MKVCVSVGHSPSAQGACNLRDGISEYQYNSMLVVLVREELEKLGIDVVVVSRTTLNELPNLVNQTKADIAVELHCNAFDENTSGSEVLHFTTSSEGALLATFINEEVCDVLGLRNRGIKPSDRELLLKKTTMPCVIVEPFFIDKDSDLRIGIKKMWSLAKAIAVGIHRYNSVN